MAKSGRTHTRHHCRPAALAPDPACVLHPHRHGLPGIHGPGEAHDAPRHLLLLPRVGCAALLGAGWLPWGACQGHGTQQGSSGHFPSLGVVLWQLAGMGPSGLWTGGGIHANSLGMRAGMSTTRKARPTPCAPTRCLRRCTKRWAACTLVLPALVREVSGCTCTLGERSIKASGLSLRPPWPLTSLTPPCLALTRR